MNTKPYFSLILQSTKRGSIESSSS